MNPDQVFAGDLSNGFGLVLDHLIYGEKIFNNPVNVCFRCCGVHWSISAKLTSYWSQN